MPAVRGEMKINETSTIFTTDFDGIFRVVNIPLSPCRVIALFLCMLHGMGGKPSHHKGYTFFFSSFREKNMAICSSVSHNVIFPSLRDVIINFENMQEIAEIVLNDIFVVSQMSIFRKSLAASRKTRQATIDINNMVRQREYAVSSNGILIRRNTEDDSGTNAEEDGEECFGCMCGNVCEDCTHAVRECLMHKEGERRYFRKRTEKKLRCDKFFFG